MQLLLSVGPALAGQLGGPSAAAYSAGLFTGGSIVGELSAAWCVRRLGLLPTACAGVVFLATSTTAFLWASSLSTLYIIWALRGFGFGLSVVTMTNLAAVPAPLSQDAVSVLPLKRVGLFGLVASAGAICAPAAGLALFRSGHLSAAILLAVALAATAGMCMWTRWGILLVSLQTGPALIEDLSKPARRSQLPYVAALMPGTLVYAGVYFVLPLWRPEMATAALLTFGVMFATGRWMGAHATVKRADGSIFSASLLLLVVGLVVAASTHAEGLLLAACAACGGGAGILAGMTLVGLLQQGRRNVHSADGAAVWNLSFDLGVGLSALLLGLVLRLR